MTTRDRSVLEIAKQLRSLRADTDYEGTLQAVHADAELGSGNLWALAFAILIASVGLNVNSTAVVIGAMLISPLMGPIVGAGLALGTDDVALLRRSLRALLVSTVVALLVSTVYFALSPLAEAQSELLARTRPTLYDVLIALFGGSAGIVAVSRKTKTGYVVPGVAIATALMPPLCTASFGLAHGSISIFVGAMHLFLINALFICLATIGFVRLMRFARVTTDTTTNAPRLHAIIGIVTLTLLLPSVYTAWTVVQETRFQSSARRFVANHLRFSNRSIINVELRYARDSATIEATVLGDSLSRATLDSLRGFLPDYGLANARLVMLQPLGEQPSLQQLGDAVRQGMMKDLFSRDDQQLTQRDQRIRTLEDEVRRLRAAGFPIRELTGELAVIQPALVSLAIGQQSMVSDTSGTPLQLVVVASWTRVPSSVSLARVRAFLAMRLQRDSIHLLNVVDRAR